MDPSIKNKNAIEESILFQTVDVDKPSPGYTTVTFADSVPMSTYLACFIVSDFTHVTKNAKRLNGESLPVNVYTTKMHNKKGAFALDVAVKTIEHYIKIFDIDYPLPKLGKHFYNSNK